MMKPIGFSNKSTWRPRSFPTTLEAKKASQNSEVNGYQCKVDSNLCSSYRNNETHLKPNYTITV